MQSNSENGIREFVGWFRCEAQGNGTPYAIGHDACPGGIATTRPAKRFTAGSARRRFPFRVKPAAVSWVRMLVLSSNTMPSRPKR